jgi:hypothetical protein
MYYTILCMLCVAEYLLPFFYICVFLPLNMQVIRYGGEKVQYFPFSETIFFQMDDML